MTAVGWLVLIGALLLIGAVAWLSWPRVVTAVQAHRDYRRARGTLHRAEIERALSRLDQRVAEERGAMDRAEGDLRGIAQEEDSELDRALTEHLVRTRLDEVPGVGRSRVEAIRTTIFRGRLCDLLRADDVPGIGPQTAEAIADWVARMEADWSKLRSGAFPEKTEIAERYARRCAVAEQQRRAASRRLDELDGVAKRARAELERLQGVTPGAFRRSLRSGGMTEDADLQAYVLGVFPPWESPPRWYTALTEPPSAEWKG